MMFKIKGKKLDNIIWGIVFSIIPIISFYLMEAYEHNPFVDVRQMAQLFNIIIFELLAWVLYSIIGRTKVAIRLILIFSMIFGLINHYVMIFRASPFVPWDIFSVGTAASVASNYDFTPSIRVVIVTVIFVILIIMSHFVNYKMKMKFQIRLIPTVLLSISLCLFVNMLWDDDFQNRNYLYPFLFTPAYMTQVNGMAVTFAMDLEYMAVDKPSGYSAKKAVEQLKQYEGDSYDSKSCPNIIVVMDEAFSDLAVLGELNTNVDYMPFVHSLQKGYENTVTGNLNVSVCGGNTADTEFEFLTGNTMAFLPTGSIPYQQYIKSDISSLASHLKSLGYATYAQHPYYASGWNRDKVYKWMGFDELTFVKDYSSRKIIRKYVSDESSFNQIIKTFEEKEDGKPAFIFNVTMQNHGGYSDSYPDFENKVNAIDKNSEQLNQYLTLLSITDEEYRKLLEYFSNVEEDTIVVFFGDHQPNDAVASVVEKTYENDYNRYQVPYVIWANFDIAEASGADTSANYLAANVLELAGIKTNSYHNYLLELEKQYPIISAVRTEGIDDADDDKIKEYQKLQYYMLFDWEEK